MLFAGWEVCIVKNCDRGLENAARGRRPKVAFSSPRSQLFTLLADPRPANNMFIFFSAVNLVLQITNGFASVCLRNFVIESTCSPSTNDGFIKNLRSERVIQIPDKDVSKKRYSSNYFTIVC